MQLSDFNAIIAEIESPLSGEGYTLDIFTEAGTAWRDYSWQRLRRDGTIDSPFSVIILSKDDQPNCYMPLSSIIAIQRSN
jgi:hypothetical protein